MKRAKQISAIIAIVLLVGMYIATLIFAFLDIPGKAHIFNACIYATIIVPIVLYILMMIYKLICRKNDDTPNE